jgi:hypothetical protein
MRKQDFQMPYEYFRDDMTRTLEKSQPELVDPEACYQAFMRQVPDGEKYLLNKKNIHLFRKNGPLKPPYYPIDDIEDAFLGQDAFVFCPGPSMDIVDTKSFEGKLTIAVNSAGFKFKPTFWAMFESNYMLWLVSQKTKPIPKGLDYIMTARCAIRWRDMFKKTKLSNKVYVPRFEELRTMPHRTPAVGTMGALVSAWWLGAKRVFIIGMDLSRPKDQPYTKGVPFSSFGASNPFDEQIRALRQFQLPDFEVINGSPYSKDAVPFTHVPYDEIQEIATSNGGEKPANEQAEDRLPCSAEG